MVGPGCSLIAGECSFDFFHLLVLMIIYNSLLVAMSIHITTNSQDTDCVPLVALKDSLDR